MSIRQILWDWNGTLLDDLRYTIDVRNRIFPIFGISGLSSIADYHSQFTFPVSVYYGRAGVTNENFETVANAWMNEYVRGCKVIALHADALETIARFKSAGLAQVVLSASPLDLLLKQLSYAALDETFAAVLGLSHIYATSKEAIGREYLEGCGIPPAQTVMIGDTLHDADVAKALGAQCVLVARGHQSKQTLLEAGVKVVDTLAEAAEWILEV